MNQRGTRAYNPVEGSMFESERELMPPPANADDEFRDLWYILVGDLPEGYFKPSDRPTMELYIQYAVLVNRIRAQLQNENLLEDDGKGKRVANPLLRILDNASTQLATLATKLRVVPSGRLHNSSTPRESELAKRNGMPIPTPLKGMSQNKGTGIRKGQGRGMLRLA